MSVWKVAQEGQGRWGGEADEDEEFVRLTYRCCNDDNEEFIVSDKAFNLNSVENKRFAKVRRENLIVKQKEMDLTVIGF